MARITHVYVLAEGEMIRNEKKKKMETGLYHRSPGSLGPSMFVRVMLIRTICECAVKILS